jgi:hypothetical protein
MPPKPKARKPAPARCRHPKAARKKTMAMTPIPGMLAFSLRWTEICGDCKGRRKLGTRAPFVRAAKKGKR